MPEWGEFWRLMAFALAVPVFMMAGVWLLARILNNAGIVDIFWSYGFIPVAAVCAVLAKGDVTRNFGCHVTTVTISQAQFDEASRRIVAAGLGDRIKLLLQDYRTLRGQ
ncbi:MAG: hypothetical protein ACKOJB_14480, partial [Chthoniobacterales bacterium]